MNFISTIGKSPAVSFRDALFRGMAADGGLYIPDRVPQLSPQTLDTLEHFSVHALGQQTLSSFIDEIPPHDLELILQRAWNFSLPLVKLTDMIFLLELFHGPTLAFKDVGARFMAEALSFFLVQENREITIVVATSGDTGSAVAHGFYNAPNIRVFILYPSGKISRLQEQQMTTLGANIHAVEVQGTFDDCQRLVKQALADPELVRSKNLTTANSINLGRLLPQTVYYVWALAQLRSLAAARSATFVVPSGNFGNLTAAIYAKYLGVAIDHVVAATNANDVVVQYLETGAFTPRTSLQTLSNAMDVGNPSNLARLQALYQNDVARMRSDVTAMRISDEETLGEIRRTYNESKYILDPHTAVGVAAARKFSQHRRPSSPVVVAATAHPAKFPEIIEQALGVKIPLPAALQDILQRQKHSTAIAATYSLLKELLVQ
jgi:threonine synthase